MKIGDVLGEYKIVGELGAGGIGKVYRVVHQISNRTEAMKILHPDQLGTPEMAERFVREIRVLASLNHPNIAALHTAFRDGDQLVMIMEFVEGVNLSHKLRSEGISMWTSVDYISQVLSALVYAHGRGVIHRDIKPSNIMITGGDPGVAKLLDFGLARNTLDAEQTRSGSVVGSLHYMSPEQVRGERVDARSDLYSLGATLYELVTGSPPFLGDTPYAIMEAHLHEKPKPPAAVNPSLPRPLSQITLQALEKNPEARFQTAEEFLRALESLRMEWTAVLPPQEVHTKIRGPYRTAGGTQAASSVRTPATSSRFTPAALKKIASELAEYIGPIATIVVDRAAPRCRTLEELYQAVAKEIDSSGERDKFLANRPRTP